jgi:hypothetical protein
MTTYQAGENVKGALGLMLGMAPAVPPKAQHFEKHAADQSTKVKRLLSTRKDFCLQRLLICPQDS